MRVATMLVRVAVFVAALTASVFITRLYRFATATHPSSSPAAPVLQMTGAHADETTASAQGPAAFSFKPQLITLDFATRKSHTLLVLERASSFPAPEKLWVTTHFFTKADGASAGREACASDAVEVWRAFAGGHRSTTVTVTASANACRESSDPAATYYAIVEVSTEPGNSTRHLLSSDYDLTSLTPVMVERSAGR
jgi:hypothetical protein